jgi:hypothetical protein
MAIRDEFPEPPSNLGLDRETLAYIVLKARAFDELTPNDDPDDASDAADDRFVSAMEDDGDNPVGRELRVAITDLDVDAQTSLVALMWMGRGDYASWKEAYRAARERAEAPTWRYLMGEPLLGDYLEEGAAQIGVDLTAEKEDGLGDPDLDTREGD